MSESARESQGSSEWPIFSPDAGPSKKRKIFLATQLTSNDSTGYSTSAKAPRPDGLKVLEKREKANPHHGDCDLEKNAALQRSSTLSTILNAESMRADKVEAHAANAMHGAVKFEPASPEITDDVAAREYYGLGVPSPRNFRFFDLKSDSAPAKHSKEDSGHSASVASASPDVAPSKADANENGEPIIPKRGSEDSVNSGYGGD